MNDLAAALMVAIRVHAAQRDKQGEPYLLHVLRVVEAVSDEAKVAAALHDAFEDGEWGADEASEVCEALDAVDVEVLDYLTRVGDETYAEYIERLARSYAPGEVPRLPSEALELAREVKLADLHDNLGRIPPFPGSWEGEAAEKRWSRKWDSLRKRYEKALAVLEGEAE